MRNLEEVNFLGALDRDTDPLFVKGYTEALNVRHITDNTESTQSIIPIKGTKYATLIPATVAQSKIYAVTFDSTTNQSVILKFTDSNGFSFNTAITILASGPSLATQFYTPITGIQASIQNFLTALGITSIVTLEPPLAALTGKVIINPTNRIGTDYTIESVGTTLVPIEVVQDEIDAGVAGEANIIGSYDLLGDLFLFSTSAKNLPTKIFQIGSTTIPAQIFSIVGGGLSATVTLDTPHGLVVNQKIVISGNSVANYNGNWTVASTPSITTFTISANFGVSAGGEITIYPQGIGEIGVLKYNADTDVYSYTRLIRSAELNFVTKKQIDCYVEQNNIQKSLYWTDDYNTPRAMYYNGEYTQDGFLTYYNSENTYDLDTVSIESRLAITSTATRISGGDQIQSGGNVKSGNWRYAIRYATENGTTTDWTDLTNPLPVFKASTLGAPSLISGDAPDTVTTKINTINVSNIIPGVFKYIDLAGVNYVGSGTIGYILSRTEITDLTSLTISHNGFETNVQSLDLGTLNVKNTTYATAKNINAIDNRLIISNLTSSDKVDFSSWTATWTHKIQKKILSAVNEVTQPSYSVGEYAVPSFVFNNAGYMANETYRFMAKFLMKDGTVTDTFWIDDIRIDDLPTNINNETPNRRITTGSYYSNFAITDSLESEIYVPYVEIGNVNLDYLINGVKVRNLIDQIYIERAEVVPEILATGVAILSTTDGGGNVGSLTDNALHYDSPSGTVRYGEYPFSSPRAQDGTTPARATAGTPNDRLFAFYSPDIIYGNITLSFLPGDTIINFGQASRRQAFLTGKSSGVHYDSAFADYTGTYSSPQLAPINVTHLKNIQKGGLDILDTFNFTKGLRTFSVGPVSDSEWQYVDSPVILTDTDLLKINASTDYGVYYVQYKREIPYGTPDTCKYGRRGLTRSIPTGTSFVVTLTTASPSFSGTPLSVFGGDTFTQKSFLKNRFPFTSVTYTPTTLGWGGGIGFYSQNKVNSQLNRKYGNSSGQYDFPNLSTLLWLEDINTTQISYNFGYNLSNAINSNIAFDSNLISTNNFPTRIAWSDLKVQNGISDNYRSFLPLNFKELDLAAGEIVHHSNGNGELLTWQPRKFQRQYFNTRGVLQQSNLDILIGDGGVMSRDGQTLSVIGSKHKWAIIKGKSTKGNDTFYWINTELKKVMRFGYDGTISLADIKGMNSFVSNYLTWADDKDNPADGQGIHGVWDDRYSELCFVVRAKRDVNNEYSSLVSYSTGAVVSLTGGSSTNFEQTGEFYVALRPSINKYPENNPQDWQVIAHNNSLYYNEYNLVYNEYKNAFTAFYSFLPKIFMKWQDTYFSPKPISNTGRIYIHNKGSYCQFYDAEQVVDGYIEGVVNKSPQDVKWFEAIRSNCEIRPERYDFLTKDQTSFLTSGEFTSREGNFDSPIKMDSGGQTVNDAQTSRLYGKYLKVRMKFKNGVYQKLFGFIVKFRTSVRYPNK